MRSLGRRTPNWTNVQSVRCPRCISLAISWPLDHETEFRCEKPAGGTDLALENREAEPKLRLDETIGDACLAYLPLLK
jgi:hypothetical protein